MFDDEADSGSILTKLLFCFSMGEAESAQILTGTVLPISLAFSTAHSRGNSKEEFGVRWLRRLQNATV